MPLESATFIDDLVATNPVGGTDSRSQGDDHIRLIKAVLKNTFPNLSAAINITAAESNAWFDSGEYTLNSSSLTYSWADDSATGIEQVYFKDSASPANNDVLYQKSIHGNNSIAGETVYARDITRIESTTDGDEAAERLIQTMVDGVLTTRIHISNSSVLIDGVQVTDSNFASGTRMLFQQTAAPLGWAKDTTHNNKAMRLVNGSVSSGGTVAFTTAFASKAVSGTVGNTALSVGQLPAHNHDFSGTTGFQSANHTHSFSDTVTTSAAGAHTHTFGVRSTTAGDAGAGGGNDESAQATPPWGTTAETLSAGNHSHSVTVSGNTGINSGSHQHTFNGTTSTEGSGGTHTHSFTGTAIDLAVQYVDFIIAVKD